MAEKVLHVIIKILMYIFIVLLFILLFVRMSGVGRAIFADDAWFQKNMGDFREKYGLRCVLQGFSVPMKVEEKWAFVSRLVKAKAMQDEPSEIMKNIYALERV